MNIRKWVHNKGRHVGVEISGASATFTLGYDENASIPAQVVESHAHRTIEIFLQAADEDADSKWKVNPVLFFTDDEEAIGFNPEKFRTGFSVKFEQKEGSNPPKGKKINEIAETIIDEILE